MDHDWQPRRTRHFELPAKHLLLHVPRRMIIVIVETNLAPGNHPGKSRQFLQIGKMRLRGKFRFVGVNADSRGDPVLLLGKWKCCIQVLRASTAADGKQRGHARSAGAFEHFAAVCVELREFEMGVRIDNFHLRLAGGWPRPARTYATPLFQPRSRRHILSERAKHRAALRRHRRGDNHAV